MCKVAEIKISFFVSTKQKHISSLHISKAQAKAKLPKGLRTEEWQDPVEVVLLPVYNFKLNQTGFYGDEDIKVF